MFSVTHGVRRAWSRAFLYKGAYDRESHLALWGCLVRTAVDLPTMLRHETAELHRQVERDVCLPDAVSTRADYVALLQRLFGFHSMVESIWLLPHWESEWQALEINLLSHRRTPQLSHDLTLLGVHDAVTQAPLLNLERFGEVLGSLYVVEGSALGGQMLAPHLRAAAGDVPTTFFDSEGRNHPKPWRAVKAALVSFDERTGNNAHVLEGARATFAAFGSHVGRATWSGLL